MAVKNNGTVQTVDFGGVYNEEVHKTCRIIFKGEVTPDNLANTVYLLERFDYLRAQIQREVSA